MGPKVTTLVARSSRQVHATFCVGFADVTRIRRESGAYVTQMLREKFAYDVRHVARVIMQMLRARDKGYYFWTPR
jgi:hypothetical protein